jgi:hypothetical protein
VPKRMTLPGPQKGPWQVTYESGRNVVIGQTTWTTVITHPSGWQVVYDEADRAGVLLTPSEDLVLRVEPLPDEREVLDFLVGVAQDWIAVNAASRGLPTLD